MNVPINTPTATPAPDVPNPAPGAGGAGGAEARIDPNPVSPPSPISNQAPQPQQPQEDTPQRRATSRREAIRAAFDKAEAKGRPGPAEAKPGHNQPPEPIEKPQEQPQRQPQHREAGRFARAPEQTPPGDGGGSVTPGRSEQPGQRQAPRRLPRDVPYADPPPRFSDRAKHDWADTPESIRGDIYRMHQEVDGFVRRYRGDHEEMNTIRPYAEMARQHGTTLQRALSNYTSMEAKLRESPLAGLEIIVDNLNLRTQNGHKLTFRDIAYYALSQSPEQHNITRAQNQQSAQQHQIGRLYQIVDRLARSQQAMQTGQQFAHTRAAVDQFAASHPRFDELGEIIQQELKAGWNLEQAYQRAVLLRPDPTQAAQTRDTPAQTRSRESLSGVPEGTSNGTGRKAAKGPAPDRRAAIAAAMRSVAGSA